MVTEQSRQWGILNKALKKESSAYAGHPNLQAIAKAKLCYTAWHSLCHRLINLHTL